MAAEAVPKKILAIMQTPDLTRENVASHLQKYRQYLKRVAGVKVSLGFGGKHGHTWLLPAGAMLKG